MEWEYHEENPLEYKITSNHLLIRTAAGGKEGGKVRAALGMLKMIFFFFSMNISMRILLESMSPPPSLPKTRSAGHCGSADVTFGKLKFSV